ncbi:hypothetical protein FEF09_29860 [Chitinophaga pinensis]|uniref:Uncharacterized protein n=1 Tax=Chitinophaga pinensis TaxID=79329 RepID=A0A5C6LJS2_9BACT|nr:glycosyl hydrolase 115 family protein [Chitinophaga pinensis]TWV89608.1 hypothetical protein FEF09_29860 [Chitinophaga pinensis]
MGNHESIVTIGMRGDGDEPMTQGTATALLERIVKDQRQIISDITGRPANATPQLWALYKEVQDYYDKGMRVPDDVTLLLCDDNWGNIRKLPDPGEDQEGAATASTIISIMSAIRVTTNGSTPTISPVSGNRCTSPSLWCG